MSGIIKSGETDAESSATSSDGDLSREASFFFSRFDVNGDSFLDFAEFAECCDEIGWRPCCRPAAEAKEEESAQAILADMRASRPLAARLEPSEELLKAEFALGDVDQDGVLSFEEWCGYYAKHANAWRTPFEAAYRMEGIAGRGAFGVVRLGEQRSTGRRVAVKQIEKTSARTARLTLAEIAIWEGLHHPHLLELLDVHETPSSVLLVTPLMAGGDLFNAIGRMHAWDSNPRAVAEP